MSIGITPKFILTEPIIILLTSIVPKMFSNSAIRYE